MLPDVIPSRPLLLIPDPFDLAREHVPIATLFADGRVDRVPHTLAPPLSWLAEIAIDDATQDRSWLTLRAGAGFASPQVVVGEWENAGAAAAATPEP